MIEVSDQHWGTLRNACRKIDDPPTPINIFHPVENVIALSLAAIIAGGEGPKSIARWAKKKKEWLETWLDLPEGKTPRRDGIRTFLAEVAPAAFQNCFFEWLDGLAQNSEQNGQLPIVAIDGKALRHSFDPSKDLRSLHMVSAWVAEHLICRGQVATEKKSNEITAIPVLLEPIERDGAVGHRVAGDVQDMIGFVIRKGSLQSFDIANDRIDQPTLPSHGRRQPDAPVARCRLSPGNFILNTRRRKHGTLVILARVPGADLRGHRDVPGELLIIPDAGRQLAAQNN